MKIFIASDIHGSTACIKKLIKRIDIENAEQVIFLGDILYHGPRNALPLEYDTREAANLLNKRAELISSVKGNCDAEVDQILLDFNVEAPHMILNIDGINIFATHGHHYNTSYLPAIASFDILLHGHTHIPAFEEIKKENGESFAKKKYYINPGSVSIPKGGSTNSYLIFENLKFIWKDLDCNVYKEEIL